MLSSLYIENLAVIKRLSLELFDGFTALTGETGAGKSVMMESLYLLMGERADRELIRHGEEKATVSALFTDLPSSVCEELDALGIEPDEDGTLSLSRSFGTDGRNTCRVNSRPVSLSVFREISPLLLHIHSQDDAGLLKKAGGELSILDSAAHNEEERTAYRVLYERLLSLSREAQRLRMDESERIRTEENLRFAIAEINAVAPVADEEEALFDEKLRLRHIEKISKQTSFAYRALRGAEKGNACYILDRAAAALRSVADVLPEAGNEAQTIEGLLSELEEVASRIPALADTGDRDPSAALDEVEGRLAELSKLKRKYGASLSDVIAYRDSAEERLSLLLGSADALAKVEREYAHVLDELSKSAARLSETRKAAADVLEREIAEALRALDMPSVRFRIALSEKKGREDIPFDSSGGDEVAFMIAVNPGEPELPVVRSVSGGEMSRILLAIKTVIASHDGLPTVIFDEVDSGVSGKTSRKMGFSLKNSSRSAQILCITHSAQIASLADRHLLVRKEERDGRTESSVCVLEGEARVEELARILGGIAVTESQRSAARDMLLGEAESV